MFTYPARWVVSLTALLGAAMPSLGQQNLDVVSRFNIEADNAATPGEGVQEFFDLFEALAGVTVQQQPLADLTQSIAAVRAGQADIGCDIVALQRDLADAAMTDMFSLLGESIPFGPSDLAYLSWLNREGFPRVERMIEQRDGQAIRFLAIVNNVPQAGGMSTKELTLQRWEDGFPMRIFGRGQAVVALAFPNMKPLFLPPTETNPTNIVNGFLGGTLVGAEFVAPRIDKALIYDAVAAQLPMGTPVPMTHYYAETWQSPATVVSVYYNPDRLTARQELALRVAAFASLIETQRDLRALGREALAELQEDYGQTLSTLPKPVLDRLRQATVEVIGGVGASNPDYADAVRSMGRYQRER